MLITKIIINKTRDIKPIDININDNLINYLINGGEPNTDGIGGDFHYFLF